MDITHGGDAAMAGPEIKTLADIKVKRVSIVNIPLGLYMLNRMLDNDRGYIVVKTSPIAFTI